MDQQDPTLLPRRHFFTASAAAVFALQAAAQSTEGGSPWPPVRLVRRDLPLKALAFPLTSVRLLDGPFHDAQEVNRRYLHRVSADRLLHTFRLTAGLPSTAFPLGGWEKPDGELRGHFTGHYLTACSLMFSSTDDEALRQKANGIVAELAKCQAANQDGYLSAYPREFWDRLRDGKKVWAPFYTLHKIMAGLLDVHEHCGNAQALEVLEGLAGWVDRWTEPLGEVHMQKVLTVEYGGIAETLYQLWAVTGKVRYAEIGGRFDHLSFFDPLALRRDELKGLHANTHIPQVTGAARRYELTQEPRYRDIADFFWTEVSGSRSYVNGGTSNRETWLTEPRKLAAELRMATSTNECCKAYNMMKLTRHLYQWTADPRYFDYYERALFNHRLGTIHPETGGTIYYVGLNPGSWKTFSTEDDSFWCCTGSGSEEYSKLGDSIYFHDDKGLFVNLFVASDLHWAEKGLRLRQTTRFPEQDKTSLAMELRQPVQMDLRIRTPWWATQGGSVLVNGKAVEAFASPGGYLTLSRLWRNGDRVDIRFPMSLHIESMPDNANMAAVLYGPLVLIGDMGATDPAKEQTFGPMGPTAKTHENPLPVLRADRAKPESWLKPDAGESLTFHTVGQSGDWVLRPYYKVFGRKYTVYWEMQGA